jgi:hypothetical protein
MSDAVDTRLRELVRAGSDDTKEAIFEDLLREVFSIQEDLKSIPLVAADGEFLGMLVRPAPVGPPPSRSPEEEAEYQRRLATMDDVVDTEEMIRLVTQRVPAGSGSR